jgi:hypothetical protein
MDIIGRDETFSEPGVQVSGVRFQAGSCVFTTDTLYETSSELRRVGHRADHIPAGTVAHPTLPKFLIRFDRPFFWPAAALTPECQCPSLSAIDGMEIAKSFPAGSYD